MREIKYRALPLLDSYWEYGFYTEEGGHSIIRRNDSKPNEEGTPIIVRRETRGQYTGLKDKNDVEIYEGDILEADSSGTMLGSVFYEGFQGYNRRKIVKDIRKIDFWNYSHKIKVVGNVFENFELIDQ